MRNVLDEIKKKSSFDDEVSFKEEFSFYHFAKLFILSGYSLVAHPVVRYCQQTLPWGSYKLPLQLLQTSMELVLRFLFDRF